LDEETLCYSAWNKQLLEEERMGNTNKEWDI